MWIKFMGILAVLFGAMGLGSALNKENSQKYECLLDWKRILDAMDGEIAYQNSTLPEICRRIGNLSHIMHAQVMLDIEREIKLNRGLTFGAMWKERVKTEVEREKLQVEIQELLCNIGNQLNYENPFLQRQMIKESILMMEKVLTREESVKAEKRKVTMCLAMASGAVLTVLLV